MKALIEELPPNQEVSEELPEPQQKKRGRPKKDHTSNTGTSASVKELTLIRDTLSSMFMLISMGVGYINPLDAQIVMEKSVGVIDAIIGVAKRNGEVKKLLLRISKTGAYAELITAMSMMIIPIAANHGYLPPIAIFAGGLSNELTDALVKSLSEKQRLNAVSTI